MKQGRRFEIDPAAVSLTDDSFLIRFSDGSPKPIITTIRKSSSARRWLAWNCSHCQDACEHVGAAFAFALEEKTTLGLAQPPPEPNEVQEKSVEERVHQALLERTERAAQEKMRVNSSNAEKLWTDYTVMNTASGKTYRVALRGWQPGESFCSCPDFRKNTLGTESKLAPAAPFILPGIATE